MVTQFLMYTKTKVIKSTLSTIGQNTDMIKYTQTSIKYDTNFNKNLTGTIQSAYKISNKICWQTEK